MTYYAVPMCMACKHYHKEARDLTCNAFPRGISAAILENRADHRKPQPGDSGIRFEMADEWKGRDVLPGLLATRF
jgi:hypothetical protein